MTYKAPLDDIKFTLKHIGGYEDVASYENFEDFSWDLVEAVLEEASKVSSNVLAPLNLKGDVDGAKMQDGKVKVTEGWKEAFDEVAQGGWIGLSEDPEAGGQGMPDLVGTAVGEMWQGSNIAFALCNTLTQGAMRAIALNASDELKATYLPNMMEGTWTGTMNLTEPQAGSDLAAIRSKAVPQGAHYRISGQKIFITYGDHEMAENIIHLVLARTPDAPEGVRGISLFVVPKYLVNEDGSCGERNDLSCVSLEHKLGIHGSPTAVMSFGDDEGAIGYLVGEENRGLEYMFVMMNAARFEVGLQGLGVAEAAYQKALDYANERVQGKALGREGMPAIIAHPDVRRMLLSMKSRIEAMRAIAYYAASFKDKAHNDEDADIRKSANQLYDYLIPIVKGWLTEIGQEITSIGVQIHGGNGFIEETGAAQFYRDSRITTIYEGTTGIQAADLAFRKTARDGGAAGKRLLQELNKMIEGCDKNNVVSDVLLKVEEFIEWAAVTGREAPAQAAAASDAYLHIMGTAIGAALMVKSASAASESDYLDSNFVEAKNATADFYIQTYVPQIEALIAGAKASAETVTSFEDRWF